MEWYQNYFKRYFYRCPHVLNLLACLFIRMGHFHAQCVQHRKTAAKCVLYIWFSMLALNMWHGFALFISLHSRLLSFHDFIKFLNSPGGRRRLDENLWMLRALPCRGSFVASLTQALFT